MMEEDTGTDFWLPSAYMYTSVHIHMVREETEREKRERKGREKEGGREEGRGERKKGGTEGRREGWWGERDG